MTAMDVGRVCIKVKGREAGKRCIVIDLIDRKYVLITGPKEINGVRRRRVNMSHLKPLDERLDIERNASDEEILEILRK